MPGAALGPRRATSAPAAGGSGAAARAAGVQPCRPRPSRRPRRCGGGGSAPRPARSSRSRRAFSGRCGFREQSGTNSPCRSFDRPGEARSHSRPPPDAPTSSATRRPAASPATRPAAPPSPGAASANGGRRDSRPGVAGETRARPRGPARPAVRQRAVKRGGSAPRGRAPGPAWGSGGAGGSCCAA